MRSIKTLVGTPAGVFKCTDFKRKSVQERWSMERLNNIAGSPKQPVPGQANRRSPAYSRRAGSSAAAGEFVRQPMPEQPIIRNWKIYRRDIEEHGGTPGCPGCRAVTHGMSGHAPHTALCRERIQGLIMETEEGRGRIDRAAERATAGAEQSEEERVAAPPQGGEDRTGSASAGPAVNPPTPPTPAPEATQTPLYRPTAPPPPYRPPPPRQDRSAPSSSTLPPPSTPTGGGNMETLEERLRRVARDRKRKVEAHTEDGSREPVPEPAAPAQGSTSASATTVGPSVDVGSRDGRRTRAED